MNKIENYPQSPKKLWNIFYDFTQTPRPSKNEEKIRKYLLDLARDRGLEHNIDEAHNIVMYVPGTKGRESEDSLIIQNHVDMVTDAVQGKVFNFNDEPLELEVISGWLKAKGTTLGADNGIGCACALAILFEEDISHPPLELLFTADEETGLTGAQGLDPKMLKSKRMLNLDTEDWGSFFIGCAGGLGYELTNDFDLKESTYANFYKIEVEGFIGGHSGLNIDEQRANAIKVLNKILSELGDIEVSEFRSGKAHNIIPRTGFVNFYSNLDLNSIQSTLKAIREEYCGFLPVDDQDFKFSVESIKDNQALALSNIDSKRFLNFIELFPNGVHAMDLGSNKEIVSCSNNLAKVLFVNGKAYALTSVRFFDRNEAKTVERELTALGSLTGFKVQKNSEYASWKPVRENKMLGILIDTYRGLFKQEPEITAIHAGLECGIIKDKLGEMDVCSFGPTIEGAHSPDERVHIESVGHFWILLKEVLKNI